VVEGIGDHGCEYMTGGRVVVLGQTGRNFAAGMSGGIAFVYDEDNSFSQRVNAELVDIETLENEDIDWLRENIAKHQIETGSEVARQMLDKWPSVHKKFAKVVPRHYKRVLEAIAEAEAAGIDPTNAVMSVVKGV